MTYSLVFFLFSALAFATVFFGGDFYSILIAIPLAFIGLVILYFEDKPIDGKERKEYCLKKFIKDWVDGGKGLLVMIGIYSAMVFICCCAIGLVNWCTPHTPQRPYHDAETGKGQYEYGGSREQKKDLERIDDYLKNHPDE